MRVRAHGSGYALASTYETITVWDSIDLAAGQPKFLEDIAASFAQSPWVHRTLVMFRGSLLFPDGYSDPLDFQGTAEYPVL